MSGMAEPAYAGSKPRRGAGLGTNQPARSTPTGLGPCPLISAARLMYRPDGHSLPTWRRTPDQASWLVILSA